MRRTFTIFSTIQFGLLLGTILGGEPIALFNARDLTGWTNLKGEPAQVGHGWAMEEGGVLHRVGKGGDIMTAQQFATFTLSWSWKITAKGNAGLKYLVAPYGDRGHLGVEYQLLDDDGHPDGKVGPHRQTGALYDILAPDAATKKLKPIGEWNESKIEVTRTHFTHWLNGAVVAKVERNGAAWREGFAKSKFKNLPTFAQNERGHLLIQDHNDEFWIKDLVLTELAEPAEKAAGN
jgi:hypothetical protein